ncbi:MAG TPA: pyridoxamine 5'-phosphate oxidase family protein [Burkholderiales bacterium]|nr:pyridoxamine 5'-phosphate oxidase family protein [Burkholderiales bacterium]
MQFAEPVTSEEDLRAVTGWPAPRAVRKELAALDVHCRAIISRSPFVLVSSCDAAGRMDVSPKGDPPGFVQILDETTLAIPDRPGNRRADTFRNVLQNPRVGLLFLVPGRNETLRVNGRAAIVRDLALRERMTVKGKQPELALVVSIEEVFVHCGKCMLRAGLWDRDARHDVTDLPSHARCLVDHAGLTQPLAAVEASVREGYENGLY